MIEVKFILYSLVVQAQCKESFKKKIFDYTSGVLPEMNDNQFVY